jgi:heavy metal translocating P-type ATPase
MGSEVPSVQDRSCDLCGLACGRHPYSQRIRECECFFCCLGCMNVYLILSESVPPGQDFRDTELFRRSLELGLIAKPESPANIAKTSTIGPTEELLLHVNGMWCTSCAWLIEYAVAKIPGVVSIEASFASDLVKVKYQPQFAPPSRIVDRIQSLGYEATEFRPGREREDRETRDMVLRIGLAAFLWMNVMYLSMTLYVSFFETIADSIRQYIPFVVWALATPVVFYCGYPILRVAWLGLRNRVIRADTLLALGILAAYCYSVVQAFRSDPHIYFDTACVIVTLVLTGKLIEHNAKQRASRWISLLHRMAPNKVRLQASGQERFASVEALQPGAVFVVKAGEQIAADGVVVDGESHADESLLTGESRPVSKQTGDAVVAGSVNLDGILHIRALRTAQNSTLSQVVARVEHALSHRSPLERAVDRVARIFVPSVIGLAVIAFVALWVSGIAGFGVSLMRAITVLVIACPCALGLATPLAITAAMGAASRRGILFRDSRVLETVRQVDVVVLDKTGTTTEGSFSLLDFTISHYAFAEPALVKAVGSSSWGPTPPSVDTEKGRARVDALSLVASLEQYSEHPLGKAFVTFANAEAARFTEPSSVKVLKGSGITGTVGQEHVFVGNRSLLKDQGAVLDPESEHQAQEWESEGKTVAFFGWDGTFRGMAVFGDRIRKGAAELVAGLKRQGLLVYVVSGDAPATTRWVASSIGADHYQSEVSPDKKAEFVRTLQVGNKVVAMVGDGINDAPALAQADLGIALGSGTDLAMRAAPIVLMDVSLSKIPEIFALSAETIRIIKQNLFWAFGYNVLGISLAIGGILNPILAAGAMLLSSVSVIVNSLRLARAPAN